MNSNNRGHLASSKRPENKWWFVEQHLFADCQICFGNACAPPLQLPLALMSLLRLLNYRSSQEHQMGRRSAESKFSDMLHSWSSPSRGAHISNHSPGILSSFWGILYYPTHRRGVMEKRIQSKGGCMNFTV